MNVSLLGRVDDFVSSEFLLVVAICDILADGTVEQYGLLLHEANRSSRIYQPQFRERHAVLSLVENKSRALYK